MSLLIQKKPEFSSRHEAEAYMKQKEEALRFWTSIKSIDMTDIINDLRNDIQELREILKTYEKA